MEFKGRITRVYQAGDWSAGKIDVEPYGEIGFAGACYATVGTSMILHGKLESNSKWGKQIVVESGAVDLSFDAQGLIDYLADEGRFENIGPVRAHALVEEFGVDEFQRLVASSEDYSELALVRGVTEETARIMHEHWCETRAINDLIIAFRAYGLDHRSAMKAVRVLGSRAREILEADPYRLIDLVHIPFAQVDKIERKKGVDKRDPRRIAGCVVEVLRTRGKDGHTRVDLDECLSATRNVSGYLGLTQESLLTAVQYRKDIKQEAFVIGPKSAALSTLYQAEADFTQWLVDSARYPSQLSKCRDVSILPMPEELNAQQRLAYSTCLAASVTWIYGLAGTGKTYSARLICDTYAAAGLTVMCLAPTGKAAKRLAESTDREASTIHRGLMCKPKTNHATKELKFSFDGPPLDFDLVLVDEISMIDSELMAHLIRRIDLRRTSVIFLGDVNQLVPVGPGQPGVDVHTVLKYVPGIALDEIVRQAGKLAHYCVDVLDGKVRLKSDYANGWILRRQTNDRHGRLLELFEEDWIQEFDTFSEVQVLTPQNNGPLGVHQLNVVLQRFFQLRRYGVHTRASIEEPKKAPILVGDKVIQTANDYTLGIFNGDVGIVLDVINSHFGEHKKGSILVDFGFEDPVWLLASGGPSGTNQTKNLRLAYALTVHKAQGSEYPCVIAIVDNMHQYMLTRSWLYTAVTRARETLCILGQGQACIRAASRQYSVQDCQTGRKTLTRSWLSDHYILDPEISDE